MSNPLTTNEDNTVERESQLDRYIQVVNASLDHRMPSKKWRLDALYIHYTAATKGDKFRMSLIACDLDSDTYYLYSSFGNVEYLRLKVKDIDEAEELERFVRTRFARGRSL